MSSSSSPCPLDASATDGRRDFDFLIGRWTVMHRRLRERLVGCTEWEAFAGTCELRSILGGLGNVDDNVLELPAGTYQAATLRVFNPSTRLWSIWWIDGRNPAVGQPVQGQFKDGVGTLYGDDVFNGRPLRVRFVWSAVTARSARWEQAFSADNGTTWEDDWAMTFERAP